MTTAIRPEQAFDQPWEVRAFAIAVAAFDKGRYEWPEFQQSLTEAIKRWEAGADATARWNYYEHWLTALETVLAANGLLSDEHLDETTRAVLCMPRNANHHEAHLEPVAIDPPVR